MKKFLLFIIALALMIPAFAVNQTDFDTTYQKSFPTKQTEEEAYNRIMNGFVKTYFKGANFIIQQNDGQMIQGQHCFQPEQGDENKAPSMINYHFAIKVDKDSVYYQLSDFKPCDTIYTNPFAESWGKSFEQNLRQITTFEKPMVWQWLIQFCILAVALLLGNVLRTQIPFLKKSLLPSALLGGLLLLIFKAIPGCEGLINKPMMEIVTFHALGLGFVALALKNNKIESKSTPMKVIETGALTASTYVIQGIVGLLASIAFFIFGKKIFYAAGLLLPMGYGQGPGQALNFGSQFASQAHSQGIEFAGADFGLSIAAMGFIVGSLIGVIYMNILRRKGKLSAKKIMDAQTNKLEDYEGSNEIPDSESIDKLSVQICMVLFVYFLVYLFTNWIQGMDLGKFGTNTLKPMLWGFNFLLGTLFGVLFKNILKLFKKQRLMRREYINNYMLNRISGFCFDIMIVAGTAAISFEEFRRFVVPFIVICALGAIVTFVYVLWICKHLYPDYKYEGFFSMFGMLTGTASNGMILLREIDPKFETPAANNLVLQALAAIVMGFPVMLLLGYAPQSLSNSWITLGIMVAFWAVLTIFMLRTKIFKKKSKS